MAIGNRNNLSLAFFAAAVMWGCTQTADNESDLLLSVKFSQPPDPPVLLSPNSGRGLGLSSQVTLRWKPTKGAGSYSVEVATDEFFKRIAFQATVDTTVIRTAPLDSRKYFWHVKAHLTTGLSTNWSDTWWFLINSPT